MAEGGFDPCECICSHEHAMRRLINLSMLGCASMITLGTVGLGREDHWSERAGSVAAEAVPILLHGQRMPSRHAGPQFLRSRGPDRAHDHAGLGGAGPRPLPPQTSQHAGIRGHRETIQPTQQQPRQRAPRPACGLTPELDF